MEYPVRLGCSLLATRASGWLRGGRCGRGCATACRARRCRARRARSRAPRCAAECLEAGSRVLRLDHLGLPVTDLARSRAWYVGTLGLSVEFEVPDRRTVALQDTADFTLFLQEAPAPVGVNGCALWFQVADVDATFAEWSARGVAFAHGPEKTYWGYGVELRDPDGYLIRLWDEHSMKER